MPRQTEKSTAEQPVEETGQTAAAVQEHGTGQEPDIRGVHIPGSAPGQFADHGPVTLPADAPRQ